MGAGYATRVDAAHENAMPQVSCGQVARSQWAVIVNPNAETELPDGQIGEIWLHGNNIGRGYWGRSQETEVCFRNKLQARLDEGSHAAGTEPGAIWFRTGDLGVYIDGELYITGRVRGISSARAAGRRYPAGSGRRHPADDQRKDRTPGLSPAVPRQPTVRPRAIG
ncbi:putative fatty-acid--CoA ligase [Mycobacteroides abscessus subsp. abscessus]|nr:putative fatty-acid--CoA ligase [Mycobacteroides abscessus subsp. abscessus]